MALGGTLHQEVHGLPGRLDHRSDKTVPPQERYREAHAVTLTPGGMLQGLLGGAAEIRVNSLHGQGIDRLAPGLAIEAMAPDGTIEAVSVTGAPDFALAVQWHPEWRLQDNPASRRLFAAFGAFTAARQSWLQWNPPEIMSCGRDFFGMIEAFPLGRAIPMIFRGSGDCSKIDWTFLGLTIANWSFLCFCFFALVSLVLLARHLGRRRGMRPLFA